MPVKTALPAPALEPTTAPTASASPPASPSAAPAPSASPTPSGPLGHMKWRELGPAASGGRVAAVAGSATDPYLYYLGAADGGVWKSDNGGITWDPVFDDQDVQSIGAVTIAPSDDQTVWVGTGEANPRNDVLEGDGIYKSTDGGKSWTKMGLADVRQIARIVIDPNDKNHVVVAGLGDLFKDSDAGGIWTTRDGGATWTHSLYVGPSSGGSDLAMDPKDPSVVYAGIWQFRRYPWTFSSGGTQDGLYKSTDGGTTWTPVTGNGLPSGLEGRIALAIAPSDSKRVYALIQSKSGFLYRSDDGGATWTMESDNTLIDQRPFYFSHIAVDPSDENHVYSISELPSQSKDGGKTFKAFAQSVHVDYHGIWIAPNDAKRIILGEDGGTAITVDGGENWSFSANYAIGQIYHIATDNGNPYTVCGGFQDNNGWCWPSNSRDGDGITNAYVYPVIGGDGEWTVPDPSNPDFTWADLEDGVVHIWMNHSRQSFDVEPYPSFVDSFQYGTDKYRFNWDSPIAFAPWNPHLVWYGGNVIFQSADEGMHWTAISPDLTLDDKSHEVAPGGPINYDVSGAEAFDTLLDIEGSPIARGEIWAGADDGVISLTRDGGKHWTRIMVPGVPPLGRVETIAPSRYADGTAFAVFDRHYSGDNAPYVMKTTDFGKTWTSLDANLPNDQSSRVIRQDPVNPDILYVGLDRSIWMSLDGGGHWRSLQLNLPHASVFDIQIQRQFDDLIVATHGRSAWVIDDIQPLQQLTRAQASGRYLIAPRTTYEYQRSSHTENLNADYGAPNPPGGVIIDFFQAKPGKTQPVVDIFDASGRRVRHVTGGHPAGPGSSKTIPYVTNFAGMNRYVWNFQGDALTPWYGAANEDARRPGLGISQPPGSYSVRVTFADGSTLRAPFVVAPDPDAPWTNAQYQERFRYVSSVFAEVSGLDVAFNAIDAQVARLKKLGSSQASAAATAGTALENSYTANMKNDEDSILYPGKLAEQIGGLAFGLFGSQGPPLAPDYASAAIATSQYKAAMARIHAWLVS
ncbi:MAG TPA: hypothetical protein VEJ20_01160, partial [Candidatus Eremiobacteraceae bacterium]|nr:hypothetical protein [Candidatus Eremiobacteraceae bacterium]